MGVGNESGEGEGESVICPAFKGAAEAEEKDEEIDDGAAEVDRIIFNTV